MRRGVTGLLALLLTAVALPPLLARLIGGHPPRPGPQLAALAPVATLPALAAVVLAACRTMVGAPCCSLSRPRSCWPGNYLLSGPTPVPGGSSRAAPRDRGRAPSPCGC